MREIKFRVRGKDLDGVWRYGSLVNKIFFYADTKKGVPYIFDVQDVDYRCLADLEDGKGFYEIRPETIGEFTGLRDKNGKDIFEGDILHLQTFKNLSWDMPYEEQQEYRNQFTLDELKGQLEAESVTAVCLDEGLFMVGLDWENDTYISCLWGDMKKSSPIFEYEVIGNIHDNPDIQLHYDERFKDRKY